MKWFLASRLERTQSGGVCHQRKRQSLRTPTRLPDDWLLTFGVLNCGEVANVTVKHAGWDTDEVDRVFVLTE